MAIKRIDELGAATPLLTDFLPATPTGGPSTKATVKQLYESNIFAVSVAYTGIAPPPFGAIVSAKSGAQAGSTLTVSDGVIVDNLIFLVIPSTTLTFSNLAGIRTNLTLPPAPNLTSISFPVLSFLGGNFNFNTMPTLTTLSIPSLVNVLAAFSPNLFATLTTFSAPALVLIGASFGPNTMASLTTLSIPVLQGVGVISNGSFAPSSMALLPTLSAPALTFVGTNFSPSSMASLTTFSIPVLAYVGGNFSPATMAALVTMSAPALTSVGVDLARTVFTGGNIAPATMGNLTTLTFPVIEVIGSSSSISINIITAMAALSTFTLGSTLQRVEGNVIMTSNALLVASVDGILVRLAALDGTGLTTAYSSKTVTITGTSATPSATGLAAKATLVARGCTVTHN